MNDSTSIGARFRAGLWDDNPGLVQMLGLCPLLAVTTSFVNGLGLGLATLAVLVLSNTLVSATRRWISSEIRLPMYVVIIASLVTCIELVFKAWFPSLDRTLGIFIPLIVTNCAIIGRAEAFASRNSPIRALIDGLATGLGFTACLLAVGVLREALGRGTLFSNMQLLLGDIGSDMTITLLGDYRGFLIAALPPGAFMCLGLLVAGKKYLDSRQQQPLPQPAVTALEQ